MRMSLRLAAVIAVAACTGDRSRDVPADTAVTASPTDTIPAAPRWISAVSGSGIAIVLFDSQGKELLRVACVREPAEMTIVAATFQAIGSEERLSFGVDGEPFVFVANPMADRPSGVEARAPIEPDLLRRFESARAVTAVYGAQTLGPYPPPDPETTRQFVGACRQIAG